MYSFSLLKAKHDLSFDIIISMPKLSPSIETLRWLTTNLTPLRSPQTVPPDIETLTNYLELH